jgi:putrescine transport system permease protein
MVWYFSRRAEATRKRAIQEAMDQTASESWQQPNKQMAGATA